MADHTLPTKETRAEEAEEASHGHNSGRGATPDEAAAADANDLADGTAEHYEEMTERGAHQKGEGKLP